MLFFTRIKRKNGEENVILLSTMHDHVKTTKNQLQKPSVHTMYQYTKRGKDVTDLLKIT